jgi:hypothetical protein
MINSKYIVQLTNVAMSFSNNNDNNVNKQREIFLLSDFVSGKIVYITVVLGRSTYTMNYDRFGNRWVIHTTTLPNIGKQTTYVDATGGDLFVEKGQHHHKLVQLNEKGDVASYLIMHIFGGNVDMNLGGDMNVGIMVNEGGVVKKSF